MTKQMEPVKSLEVLPRNHLL